MSKRIYTEEQKKRKYEYYLKNKNIYHENKKRWAKNNKDKIKLYKQKNRERINEQNRASYRRKMEKLKMDENLYLIHLKKMRKKSLNLRIKKRKELLRDPKKLEAYRIKDRLRQQKYRRLKNLSLLNIELQKLIFK